MRSSTISNLRKVELLIRTSIAVLESSILLCLSDEECEGLAEEFKAERNEVKDKILKLNEKLTEIQESIRFLETGKYN